MCISSFFFFSLNKRHPLGRASPRPYVTPHWDAAIPLPRFAARTAGRQGRGRGALTCHLGILTGDPRNPFLVSHLLVRFPHRKHVNDQCPPAHRPPFGQGVKKTAQLGTGPREPKSEAKLQHLSDTAKYFRHFFQKKRGFNMYLTFICGILKKWAKNGSERQGKAEEREDQRARGRNADIYI